jgi:hypothetical protein
MYSYIKVVIVSINIPSPRRTKRKCNQHLYVTYTLIEFNYTYTNGEPWDSISTDSGRKDEIGTECTSCSPLVILPIQIEY